jgi:hypothetical protein
MRMLFYDVADRYQKECSLFLKGSRKDGWQLTKCK